MCALHSVGCGGMPPLMEEYKAANCFLRNGQSHHDLSCTYRCRNGLCKYHAGMSLTNYQVAVAHFSGILANTCVASISSYIASQYVDMNFVNGARPVCMYVHV